MCRKHLIQWQKPTCPNRTIQIRLNSLLQAGFYVPTLRQGFKNPPERIHAVLRRLVPRLAECCGNLVHGIQCVLNFLKQHHQNAVFVFAFYRIRPRNCRRHIDFKHLRRQNLTACIPNGNLCLDCLCLRKNFIRQGKLASARSRICHFPLIKKCAAVRFSECDTHLLACQIDCHTVFIQAHVQISGFCIVLHRANPDAVRLFVHINFQTIIRFCHFLTPSKKSASKKHIRFIFRCAFLDRISFFWYHKHKRRITTFRRAASPSSWF